jgi:integrase
MAGRKQKNLDLPDRMIRRARKRKKSKQKVYYYYYQYRDINNKQIEIPLGTNREKALLKWAEVDVKIRSSNPVLKRDTFAELVHEYNIHEMPKKAQMTQDVQKYFIKKLLEVFGPMHVDEITPTDIARYLDTSTKKIAANREISLMLTIYNKGIRWGMARHNPCKGIEKNKEEKRDVYIEHDEYTKATDAALNENDTQLWCIINASYVTSSRRGDVLKIQKKKPELQDAKERVAYLFATSTVNEEGNEESKLALFINQGKTGKKQIFLVEEELALVTEIALNISNPNSPYLFNDSEGKAYTKTGFDSKWRRFKKRHKLGDFHFHDLRAKSATDAKKIGMDYQKLLGHSTIQMSERYIRGEHVEYIQPLKSGLIKKKVSDK